MPERATEQIIAMYAANTSYSDTPPSGRHSITIGSEQIISSASGVSDAASLPSTMAPGRSGLASSIS